MNSSSQIQICLTGSPRVELYDHGRILLAQLREHLEVCRTSLVDGSSRLFSPALDLSLLLMAGVVNVEASGAFARSLV